MDIIKTGIGITKTVRNAQRFKEILTVFGRNGFDEIIIQSGLHKIIPGFALPKKRIEAALKEDYQSADWWAAFGYRLRVSFEELGPSFIKVGQLLATREDIFDPEFIKELKLLQDKVKSPSFEENKKIIEESLENQIENVFQSFDEHPIGTASIGTAYKAKLKSGEDVVVKVRRPGIRKRLINDFEIVHFIASRLEKTSEEIKYLGITRLIEDFFTSLELELNFNLEAINAEKIKKIVESADKNDIVKIPKVFNDYTSEDIIVLEFLDGTPFNKIENIETESKEFQDKVMACMNLFCHSLLVDGFFHADLHGGNFFKLTNGQIGIIDFGLVGTLSKKNRASLVAILYALINNNFENLVYEFLDVSEFEDMPNVDILVQDIQKALTPFIGLSVQDTDVNDILRTVTLTLSKHRMYLPREWNIVFRAMTALDGVGKSLKMDLNIYDIFNKEIPSIIKSSIGPKQLAEEAIWLTRDSLSTAKIIPRHVKWFLKEFTKRKYRLDFNILGIDKYLSRIANAIGAIGLSIITSVLIISGVYFVPQTGVHHISEIPIISWIFWTFALVGFANFWGFIRKR